MGIDTGKGVEERIQNLIDKDRILCDIPHPFHKGALVTPVAKHDKFFVSSDFGYKLLEYFRFLKTETKKRYDMHMSAGAAAADIKMGKYDNWMGPERIVMNTVRLFDEFKGTLTPDIDVDGTKQAIEEYNSIKAKKSA